MITATAHRPAERPVGTGMNKSNRVVPVALLMLSMALGLAGVLTGFREANPIFVSGFTPDEAFEALAGDHLVPGPSTLMVDERLC